VVEPDLFPFPVQVSIFRKAKVVVGLGGAGMFNTIFCNPGTKIVSIESGMGFLDSHTNIFASAGLCYGVIVGEEDDSDPRPTQKRWSVQVDRVVSAIAKFIS
jgi:capsular polysaccharide biosynthesis protein